MSDWTAPIHPGEILKDELEEVDLNGAELAKRLGVPENRIDQILNRQRSITADTALRLGKFLKTGPEFWLNLQKTYELDEAREKIGDSLNEIMPLYAVDGQSVSFDSLPHCAYNGSNVFSVAISKISMVKLSDIKRKT